MLDLAGFAPLDDGCTPGARGCVLAWVIPSWKQIASVSDIGFSALMTDMFFRAHRLICYFRATSLLKSLVAKLISWDECSITFDWRMPACEEHSGYSNDGLNMGERFFLGYLHLDDADFLEVKTISCVFRRKYGFHDAPGHDDLTRFQRHAPRSQLGGKPRD
jgi:hypothetical protein